MTSIRKALFGGHVIVPFSLFKPKIHSLYFKNSHLKLFHACHPLGNICLLNLRQLGFFFSLIASISLLLDLLPRTLNLKFILSISYGVRMKNDRNTTLLQQVYNSPLTWGGPHTLWGPPHVRGLLFTCCKSVVRESVLGQNIPSPLAYTTSIYNIHYFMLLISNKFLFLFDFYFSSVTY
jgi:hypothetical protein